MVIMGYLGKNPLGNATLVYKTLNGYITHFKVKCNLRNYEHDRFQNRLGKKNIGKLNIQRNLSKASGRTSKFSPALIAFH